MKKSDVIEEDYWWEIKACLESPSKGALVGLLEKLYEEVYMDAYDEGYFQGSYK